MGDSEVATSSEARELKSPDLSCTICLATRFNTECRVSGCSHSFCFACISEWVCQSMRPSCPMCRHEIDKVFYGFEKEGPARMKIFIMEYRSMYSSLSNIDKSQLIGERRVVVRNMMQAHKTIGDIKTALTEQAADNVHLAAALNDLMIVITQHIEKSEVLLDNLRTEAVRKNKALVFANPSFRKMLYTVQIRVKYADYGKKSETRADLTHDPERLRKIVHEFLMSEFDAIPFYLQPKMAGVTWRTNFIGTSITAEEKVKCAEDIYDLMLTKNTGTPSFQTELLKILPQMGTDNAQLLDDHLEALVAVNVTDINEFYNAVFYDSTYNNNVAGFMDFGFGASMRDERQDRFEIIFQHMHRDIPAIMDWELNEGRFRRQTSNTNGTDSATNNDDDSSRSPSPEERVPTPMPDDEPHFFNPQWVAPEPTRAVRNEMTAHQNFMRYAEFNRQRFNRYRDRATREQQIDAMYHDRSGLTAPPPPPEPPTTSTTTSTTSRTIPFLDAHHAARRNTQMQEERIRSLRPNARREQVLEASRQAEVAADAQRPVTRRDNLNERVRQFEQRSIGMSWFQNLLRNIRDPTQRIELRIPLGVQNSNALIPIYMPEPRVIEAVPGAALVSTPTSSTTMPPPSAPEHHRVVPPYQELLWERIREAQQAPPPLPPQPTASEDVIFPNPATLRRLAGLIPRRPGAARPTASVSFAEYLSRTFSRPSPGLTTTSSSFSGSGSPSDATSSATETSSSVEPAPAPVEPPSTSSETPPEAVAQRTRAARRAATTTWTVLPTKRPRGN